jgi:hypothetical protein
VSETLIDRLRSKLAQAFATTWEHTQPVSVELDPETRLRDDGKLVAGARYLVQARNGDWIEVHREAAVILADAVAVDDFIARGLSILLMKHPSWPK